MTFTSRNIVTKHQLFFNVVCRAHRWTDQITQYEVHAKTFFSFFLK